ncbi:hypothetical protein ACWGKS_13300 [Nocardiopsis sp. NPDC055879]
MTHHPPPTTRVLLIDGTPGATALLFLASQRVLPPFDAVLVPDTGWMLSHTRRDLERLADVAAATGTRWAHARTSNTAHETVNGPLMPLPLHTLTADGTPGYLPHRCAHRQGVALSNTVRRLLGHPRPQAVPEGVVAACAIGATLDHTATPDPTGPTYIRFRRPLTALGWTDADCAALLAHHDLPTTMDLACIACPQRTNTDWRWVRNKAPQAFVEAVAVDATLRRGHPDPALRGTPSGTAFYLHPGRVPLAQTDLEADSGTDRSACAPWRRFGAHNPPTETHVDGDER